MKKILFMAALFMVNASAAHAGLIYETLQNGAVTYGVAPYTDPNLTKLSDGNLGSPSTLDSSYTMYDLAQYPVDMAIAGVFAPLASSSIKVYALKDTSDTVNLPTKLTAKCNFVAGGSTEVSQTYGGGSYPDNSRSTLTISTPGFSNCNSIEVTFSRLSPVSGPVYVAIGEVVLD